MKGSSIAVTCWCLTFCCTSVILIVIFGTILGVRISNSYGDNHLVETEPQYDEAARLAGYYDGNGVYQGGLPRWQDWSEGSFVCHKASESGSHCQRWSTERYYSDAVQEFLRGNCTCESPGMDLAASSAVEAAFESANFCTAWNCEETRFTQSCECDEYVTRNTCDDNRRRLKTSKSYKRTRSSGTSSSCRSYKECVAYSCQYIETPFYTACNCNLAGEERLEDVFYRLSESSYCQGWMCFQGEERYKYDDYDFNDSWDYDSYGSRVHTFSTNAFDTFGNSTETKRVIVVDNEIHYNCSKVDSAVIPTATVPGNSLLAPTSSCWPYTQDAHYPCIPKHAKPDESGLYCIAWRGASPDHGDYVEQLCECQKGTTAASLAGGFCEEWSCTSYYMPQCNFCSMIGGILLGGLILFCMIPLVTFVFLGHCRALISIPFGLAAAGLLAVFFGGVPAILEGLLVAAALVFTLGWLLSKAVHPLANKVVPGESSTVEQNKPEGMPSPATTTVVPPGSNVPHPTMNYGLMMNQPQGQMQQQTMYPGPLAPGGMQQYGVAYSTTLVNPTGVPQSFMMPGGMSFVGQQQYGGPAAGGGIQGVQPQQQPITGYSPPYDSVGGVVYQSPPAYQNSGSYGPGSGNPVGQPLYPGTTGGNLSPQQENHGGQPHHHGPGGPLHHHGVEGSPQHPSPGC